MRFISGSSRAECTSHAHAQNHQFLFMPWRLAYAALHVPGRPVAARLYKLLRALANNKNMIHSLLSLGLPAIEFFGYHILYRVRN